MKKQGKDAVLFGKTIKTMRQGLRITQIELAGKIDVDVRSIKAIEAGTANPTLKVIIGLAKALEVEIKDLF